MLPDREQLGAPIWRARAYSAAVTAALTILREIDGRPARAIVDIETLFAEADGIAQGLRSGFTDDKSPPTRDEPRSMTAEEDRRAQEEIEEIKRALADVVAKMRDLVDVPGGEVA